MCPGRAGPPWTGRPAPPQRLAQALSREMRGTRDDGGSCPNKGTPPGSVTSNSIAARGATASRGQLYEQHVLPARAAARGRVLATPTPAPQLGSLCLRGSVPPSAFLDLTALRNRLGAVAANRRETERGFIEAVLPRALRHDSSTVVNVRSTCVGTTTPWRTSRGLRIGRGEPLTKD